MVRSTEEIRWAFPRPYHRREALRPLQTLLETLARAIRQAAWPQNALALGKFLLLVDYYRDLERMWSGTLEP